MKKRKKTLGKIEKISGKIWENNINEIPDKFWIKYLGNFHWIFLNKIFIEFKFVENLKKNFKNYYFLIKFELISSIEVK